MGATPCCADAEAGSVGGRPTAPPTNGASTMATVGLVIHAVGAWRPAGRPARGPWPALMSAAAAADGIALGAACIADRATVEMMVFLAIMLHKAPAAFGLTSFLLHEGHDNTRIRKHLAAFSLAAPIGAVLTYWTLLYAGSSAFGGMRMQTTTGAWFAGALATAPRRRR